MPFRKIITPW